MMMLRHAALVAACMLGSALPLAGQGTVQAGGRVMRLQGVDTVAVAGARVVLHRIGKEVQGPIDSVVTDREGRFRVSFPRDTSALHLLSAKNAGIEYFSQPIATNPQRPDTAVLLLVHDTSVDAPVALDGRNIVISRPGEDGARRVLELLVLRNAGDKARIAADTITPSWAMALPKDVVGFNVGPGDISSEAVIPRGDSVLVFSPLAPGDKQLVFEYAVRGDRDRVTLPFSTPVRALTVLVEEGESELSGLKLSGATTDTVQGKAYRRFTGEAQAGDVLTVSWPDPRKSGRLLLGSLVGVMAAAVAFLTMRAIRPSGTATAVAAPAVAAGAPPRLPVVPPAVIDQLAALDAAHAGRQAELTPEAWAAYLAERERLLALALGAASAG